MVCLWQYCVLVIAALGLFPHTYIGPMPKLAFSHWLPPNLYLVPTAPLSCTVGNANFSRTEIPLPLEKMKVRVCFILKNVKR